ncbi:PEP/pyruvate-binding domain-containing protein [Maridesulfovibrio sp.]|uniref:PEP/pyruvate-binding domain-containing protein n=1 Tax=Maridesulfovibrio sp. TaxID=2795000 RepID=UPI002A189643|nr:PEP/pyruvate-binding domain-containing protein [Maridesulfovibrio sp.]
MRNLIDAISRFVRKPAGKDKSVSRRFLERCENFRQLLSANNSALKLMGEMTEVSRVLRPVGMTYIRGGTLRISADVRNMIERLCRIAPGKHDALKESFNRIVGKMNEELSPPQIESDGSFVLDISELSIDSMHESGSKMSMLGEIYSLGINVPSGFSITASAFRFFLRESGMDEELKRISQICGEDNYASLKLLERNAREAISLCQIPLELEESIRSAVERLESGRRISLAVRSSALVEDTAGTGFAGQFRTELGVAPSDVLEAYRNVVASMYTAAAVTYRLNHGLRDDEMVMCVGCMEMVDAVAGGVVYTCDPSGAVEGMMVVSSVSGLPCSVVDGSTCSDLWLVDRDTLEIRSENIAAQEWGNFLAMSGEVVSRMLPDGRADQPSITADTLSELVRTAMRVEKHFGSPQDIEWALAEDGTLYILQSRPLSVSRRHTRNKRQEREESRHILMDSCVPASPGMASGIVRYVDTDEDMVTFPEGGVLLARVARPELAALLPRAAAVIAEFGSSTGHLANVAREYGVPALIGAKSSVDILKEAGEVTVNADIGVVYSGLSDVESSIRSGMNGSAVCRVLSSALSHITPLNLTDPKSPLFIPEECCTLHDITRYCHEMAVREMFSGSVGLKESARQVVSGSQLQYWLIDLGGGTEISEDDQYVRIEDIRSNAMKALWTGMMAFDWEGPPDVSAGGFMSVLFGATCNPALVPGMRNSMGERNYFIVGRFYCSLQSRMGFHYSTVEGFAGRDPDMNYVLFQYKGGAADIGRRTLRVQLVAEILACHGFLTSVNGDVLYARMEGISAADAENGLKVAGYLLIHTRQLDMVMDGDAVADGYRSRFEEDIELLLTDGVRADASSATSSGAGQ